MDRCLFTTAPSEQLMHLVVDEIAYALDERRAGDPAIQPVLLMPTGNTMIELYAELVERIKKKAFSLENVVILMLDEFICEQQRRPFWGYFETHLFEPLRHAGFEGKQLPTVVPPYDPMHEGGGIQDYADILARTGGVDLCLAGLGMNGHIAFNEPGTKLEERTRIVRLTESSRRASIGLFGGTLEDVPHMAVTVGLAEIRAAKRLVMLVTGTHKAEILGALREHRAYTPEIPASVVHVHQSAAVYCDSGAQEH